MIEGILNMVFIYGYYCLSWMFCVDFVCEFICWVFVYMEKVGVKMVELCLRVEDVDM